MLVNPFPKKIINSEVYISDDLLTRTKCMGTMSPLTLKLLNLDFESLILSSDGMLYMSRGNSKIRVFAMVTTAFFVTGNILLMSKMKI